MTQSAETSLRNNLRNYLKIRPIIIMIICFILILYVSICNLFIYIQKQYLIKQFIKLQVIYNDSLPNLKQIIDNYPFPYQQKMSLPQPYNPNLISPFRAYEFQLVQNQHIEIFNTATQIRADYQWNFMYDDSKAKLFLEPFLSTCEREQNIYLYILDNYNDSCLTVKRLLPGVLIFNLQTDPGDFRVIKPIDVR